MHLSAHRFPGLVTRSHKFRAPLDYNQPASGEIEVFAREVVSPQREHDELPWLVFFQGGPGFQSPRPLNATGWLKPVLEKYRLLLLDQRGVGLSTRACRQSLAELSSPALQADYLSHFRADSIVRDAELIRKELTGGQPWTILGQSYGGFCAMRYLSAAPEGLEAALVTGGLPSLTKNADDVYRATYPRVLERNRRYFARYPEDRQRLQEIADHLMQVDVRLPSGGRLKPRMLQQLGLAFGMSDGMESVHYLLEDAWVAGTRPELSYFFLRAFEAQIPYQTNPIFALLHESIYCQERASQWAADRLRSEFPEFECDDPLCFTGEMIYRSMFEDYPELEPLREAADLLASKEDWPRLYDLEVLERNTVPVIATVYSDDMYVERAFSEETAEQVGNTRIWLTNEYDHNGLRADGEKIVGRMLSMLAGEV